MGKQAFIIIGISLGLTVLFSTLFGFAGSAIIGTFWGWFWVAMLVQIIGFVAINSYLLQRDNIQLQQAEVEALEQLSKFTIKVSCAYCQQYNTTPVQLNQRNTFKCESCNQVNGISMQFMATTLTSPIESVKIPIENSGTVEFKIT